MSREVMWGGRVDGVLSGDAVFSGRAFGVFEGEVPEPLDGWVGQTLMQRLPDVLAPAAEALCQDLAGLALALADATRDELAAQGVSGTITLKSCQLTGEPVAVEQAAAPAVATPPPVVTPPAAPPSPAASPDPPAMDLNETAGVGMLSPLALAGVPFKKAAGDAPQARQQTPPADDALPFVDDDDLPELSLEQYASLCVERTLDPAGQQAVAERYRVLTVEAMRALDEHWRQRFAKEGELHQRWQQAYAQYEAWLRSQKG